MRYYDKPNSRLVYLGQGATREFWDKHWALDDQLREKTLGAKDTFVAKATRKYLKPEDGVILEGGCGTAVHVASLTKNGYRCIGVDFAPNTVETINRAVPELDVRLADVRHLDFEDSSFVGYWSLGVIEHFWHGYEIIGREMARVIQPQGYLFLTFPYLSPLRRLKARLGFYPVWEGQEAPTSFYQFALDHRHVVERFGEWGFDLVQATPMLGLRATKEEVGALNPLLARVYHYKGSSPLVKGLGLVLSKLLTPVSGHQILLVLEKYRAQ
jgi:SAM-dependent methyltransferase